MLVQSTDFAAWIKAALLRSAAPGPARTGLRPWGPTRRSGPGRHLLQYEKFHTRALTASSFSSGCASVIAAWTTGTAVSRSG